VDTYKGIDTGNRLGFLGLQELEQPIFDIVAEEEKETDAFLRLKSDAIAPAGEQEPGKPGPRICRVRLDHDEHIGLLSLCLELLSHFKGNVRSRAKAAEQVGAFGLNGAQRFEMLSRDRLERVG